MNAPIRPATFAPAPAPAATPAIPAMPILCGEILPHELPHALDRWPGTRVLSLDCFDTLIWRDTHAPKDVFAALPGISVKQRVWAESRARRVARWGARRSEVTIAEIYAEAFAGAGYAPADPARVAVGIAAELAAEAAHCFAFAPTVALMRAARARGCEVIIVSDTYLDADQIRALIAAAAGDDVAALIDRIFCSSTYGHAKADGLYRDVLKAVKHPARAILHIGDNKGADIDGLAPFGVPRLHLKQFTPAVERQLRREVTMAAMLHPGAPHAPRAATAPQPHRAALALGTPRIADPAEAMGFAVLGPVFHAFDRWLRAEADDLQAARGGRVHWLFLLRDGWLPLQVHAAEGPCAHPAHPLEMGRYVATAAALSREGAALHHLLRESGQLVDQLGRDLLLPDGDIARLTRGRDDTAAARALIEEIRRPQRRRTTRAAGAAMLEGLLAHIRATCAPDPGDTLMLVDLGYNGTVQNRVDSLIAQGLGVHVAGRFLLMCEGDAPALDKRGMIDARHYDEGALESLVGHVAVIEQLATIGIGSVRGYAADGTPIRGESPIAAGQSALRDRVQKGVLAYAAAERSAVIRAHDSAEAAARRWRAGATGALARLMFLPGRDELDLLTGFEHDVNLGKLRKVALFDAASANRGLRQRGLFHMHGPERMYLAAELAEAGLPSRLTMFAAKRFIMPLAFSDFAESGVALPVILADGQTGANAQQAITAHPTHDGYMLAAVPVGDGRYGAALVFGALGEWLEIDSIAFVAADAFFAEDRDAAEVQTPVTGTGDGMAEIAPGLWRTQSGCGFLFVQPPERRPGAAMMLAVVFRIVVPRAGA